MVFILEIFPLFARVFVPEFVEIRFVVAVFDLLIFLAEAALLEPLVLVEQRPLFGPLRTGSLGPLPAARRALEFLVAGGVLFAPFRFPFGQTS